MKKATENEGWETNRYKKLHITRKSRFWCACDRELRSKGEKCSLPGHKIGGGKRKLKKY
jgi:hypothetical protein